MSIIISGTGRYIPEEIIGNDHFLSSEFHNSDYDKIDLPIEQIISRFKSITGIDQRRYVKDNQSTSDIGTLAAKKALDDSGIDPEKLDGIIFAHNYGDVSPAGVQSDTVPSLASRAKHALGIRNPACVAFDILFGCPGWIQGVIVASQFLRGGNAKRYLVIGAETLSRVSDSYDRDSMIYADGAGAAVLEHREGCTSGILSTCSQSFTQEEVHYLDFGPSFNSDHPSDRKYIKMQGKKIFEFALNQVPLAMKECLDKSGVSIAQLKKVFLHQANKKMDDDIIERFYRLFQQQVPADILPMTIQNLGNSSVATVPTLFDLVRRNEFEGHRLSTGDIVLFASVGAGMNINAFTYRM